jgi:hypothetical protein
MKPVIFAYDCKGSTNLAKTYEPSLNSRRPRGVIKHVPH